MQKAGAWIYLYFFWDYENHLPVHEDLHAVYKSFCSPPAITQGNIHDSSLDVSLEHRIFKLEEGLWYSMGGKYMFNFLNL
jgi:hypothetical protein